MILSIGEILADMVVSKDDNNQLGMRSFLGGAAFNVAANIQSFGIDSTFIGRVGNDLIGKYLIEQAQEYHLANSQIQIDPLRNTTLAFVLIDKGERYFTFYRHDTADYHIDISNISLKQYQIVHLGSLMISNKEGYQIAKSIVEKVKKAHKLLSFDLNIRLDLYDNIDSLKKSYQYFIQEADILKLSEDECQMITGCQTALDGLNILKKDNKLVVVTCGKNGSYYAYHNEIEFIPSSPVIPIDSTGAGDAFFGALLAQLDKVDFYRLEKSELNQMIKKANKNGAIATQYYGAITHIKKNI